MELWAAPRARVWRLAAVSAAAALLSAACAGAESLRLIGRYELPAGLSVVGVPFGGLSAIDYDPQSGLFYGLSDDDGSNAPPRFYTLNLALTAEGIAGVDILAQTPIRLEDGRAPAVGEIDPEALRIGPEGALYWAQEGGASGRPSLGVMGRDGGQIAAIELPLYYMPGEAADADTAVWGVRPNFGLEALTFDAEGHVVAAMEQALSQDGPAADARSGSLARVLRLSGETGAPMAEYLYPIAPAPALPIPPDGFQTNGLTALLGRPEGGFYALERAYAAGQGGFAALYRTSFEGATNVLGAESLEGLAPTPMKKELLYSFAPRPGLPVVENLEAMSFGPEIGGWRTLIVASDDNFSDLDDRPRQSTQFLLLVIED